MTARPGPALLSFRVKFSAITSSPSRDLVSTASEYYLGYDPVPVENLNDLDRNYCAYFGVMGFGTA